MDKVFIELGFEIVIATAFGVVAKIFKQPLVIAYIITGFILGPSIFGFITDNQVISLFSSIGIAFLLFIVGMELNLTKIREVGKKTLAIGLIQIIITAFAGYIVSKLLGFNDVISTYIGIILSFSSTVIVVNLLTEKRAVSSLYGKVVVGILVLQDIFALLVLVFLSGFSGGQSLSLLAFGAILLKTLLLFGVTYAISKLFLSRVFQYLAHSLDVLFLASIAWCFAVAGAAVYLGFSLEMGAFLAGLSLAGLPFAEEITLKLSPLRDFFLILFFVTLGIQINWGSIGGMIIPLIILSAFVIFIKSFIVLVSMGAFGFTKRTSFYTAISLSQVSEFSLIIAAIGLSLGHLNKDVVSLIVLVTAATILTSSYLITFLGYIYNLLQRQLGLFEGGNVSEMKEKTINLSGHIVLFGYHRLGRQMLRSLEKISKKVIIVDIDPDIAYDLNSAGKRCIYGDAYDPGLIEKLNLGKAKMIVTTFSGKKSNAYLIKKARSKNKNIKTISTAEHAEDAMYLYSIGADYVILPHHLSGEYMASMLEGLGKKRKSLDKIKKSHIAFLKQYKRN